MALVVTVSKATSSCRSDLGLNRQCCCRLRAGAPSPTSQPRPPNTCADMHKHRHAHAHTSAAMARKTRTRAALPLLPLASGHGWVGAGGGLLIPLSAAFQAPEDNGAYIRSSPHPHQDCPGSPPASPFYPGRLVCGVNWQTSPEVNLRMEINNFPGVELTAHDAIWESGAWVHQDP